MNITFLGQAGLLISSRGGTILCDPWFTPAYFGSWFPFPANDHLNRRLFARPDYLYISHLHHDHFDAKFLAEHVDKKTRVVLPEFQVDDLERALREIGFGNFLRTRNSEPVATDGLTFTIISLGSPTDGPIGDSALVIDDGETRILNQNDAHPLDTATLRALGPHHAHFLQFSGAIWYPMVYRFEASVKEALVRQKRTQASMRALRYATDVAANHVFPVAGPPCFLDDELFYLNDLNNGSDTSIFVDQSVFLAQMRERGDYRGRLVIPGSIISLVGASCSVEHPLPDAEVEEIFANKLDYLKAYQERSRLINEAERATWSHGKVEIEEAVRALVEPLLCKAHLTCEGVKGRVLLVCGVDEIVVDFLTRRVYRSRGESCEHRFYINPDLVETLLCTGTCDWVNSLFLSCRFEAERDGQYNEYVFNFFKCLSRERLEYLEGFYAEQTGLDEFWQCDGYLVQRRCPHLKADLVEFGQYEDGILTCTMHGWQFELATGRCLTSETRRLDTRLLDSPGLAGDYSTSAGDIP